MSSVELSVIVPVFNAGEYLRECVESVLGQSFREWELLLVDDGSTDGSGEVCDGYALGDGRIRVYHKENGGVSSARNVGLDEAQGEWIAFLDADDYLPPRTLEALVEEARASGADLTIGEVRRLLRGKEKTLDDMPLHCGGSVAASIRRLGLWGYLFRSKAIKEARLRFTEGLAFSEDRVFVFQYALQCLTLCLVEQPVYVYRINDQSSTRTADILLHASHQLKALALLSSLARSVRNTDPAACEAILGDCDKVITLFLAPNSVRRGCTRDDYRRLTSLCEEAWNGDKRKLRLLQRSLLLSRLRLRAKLALKAMPRLERLARRLTGK
ncbi:MAG: glycosyltransferase [Prevotellaceae bacterium]|nr:glycosyltransferase [Prevotellaceae bacterium]